MKRQMEAIIAEALSGLDLSFSEESGMSEEEREDYARTVASQTATELAAYRREGWKKQDYRTLRGCAFNAIFTALNTPAHN